MLTQKCKQCGAEFSISDSEIEFYKNKNLNIPKRCKKCRKNNKTVKNDNAYNHRNYSRKKFSNIYISRWVVPLFVVPIVSLIMIAATFISELFQSNNWSTDLNHDNSNQHNITYTASEVSTTLSSEKSKSSTLISEISSLEIKETNSEINNWSTDLNYDNNPQKNINIESEGESVIHTYTFRNSEFLNDHYNKHGISMNFSSAKEYEQAASNVVNSSDALHKTEKEDCDDVYYIEATNEFVIVSKDGYIRTYFNPDEGKDYYDRQ